MSLDTSKVANTNATTAATARKPGNLFFQKALEKGGVLVGDDVKIVLDIELVPAAPPQKS